MKIAQRTILVAFCFVTLAILFAVQSGEKQAQTSFAAADTNGCWQVVSAPAGPQAGEIYDLTTATNGDLWALGGATNGGAASPYLLHMYGAQWTTAPGPSFTQTVTRTYSLNTLKVFAPNDIWVAGSINYDGGGINGYSNSALALHWNGTVWSEVLSDTVGGGISAINGVSSNDMWAVGEEALSQAGDRSVILHWNGKTWTNYVSDESSAGAVNDVAALASDNVWLVGDGLWHWNGKALSEDQTQSGTSLHAITANDIWMVGSGSNGATSAHWNGTAWQPVNVPGPGRFTYLNSVTAFAMDDVWAAGSYDGGALVLHWDGASWQAMPNPVAGFSSSLDKIVGANGALWAIGSRNISADDGHVNGVLMRYGTTNCSSNGQQTPLNPPAPVPGSGSQEFVTGKSASGVFLNYWLNHGGVLQQGYPISDPIGEQSSLNGQIYTVQYFERAVFEYHADLKGTPYEVLLSQLGTFQYKQKYPDGAPNQRPNKDSGTVHFAETGKYLGGRFLAYWNEHGGVQQNGYPISDEFTEVSDLDGRPYTVQYFERAVFEWHPENAPPYDVLLSQLGRYEWENRYEKKQATGQVPRKIAGSVLLGQLKGAGRFLVWPDIRDNGLLKPTIYAYNAQQNTQQPISQPLTAPDGLPMSTNGKVALWNRRDTENQSLEGYNLESNSTYKVDPPAQMDFRRVLNFGLDADTLYYLRSNYTANMGLYAHDLATGDEQHLADPTGTIENMQAGDGAVLWVEDVAGGGGPEERALHLAKASTPVQQVTVADGIGGFTGYGISGDNVVYSFFTDMSNQTTYLYNVASGSRKVIALGRASDPVIKGDTIAWVRWPDPAQAEANGWSIEVYTISTGKTVMAAANLPAMPHNLVLLDGGTLAYAADVDMSTPGYDLFVVDGAR